MIEVLLQAESALSLGLLDQAEILYRQVVIADPRNSIAVVGLARVALERGDEAGALAQARRALVIDAENAAAQRMVQRLEEVLAFRGGPGADNRLPADASPGGGVPAGATPATAPSPPEADVVDLPAVVPVPPDPPPTGSSTIEPTPAPSSTTDPPATPRRSASWLARIVRRNR